MTSNSYGYFFKKKRLILLKTNVIIFLMALLLISCHSNSTKKSFLYHPSTRTHKSYERKYANAIIHYSAPKDSLKLRALNFILENLKDQYFIKGDWINSYNNSIVNSKTLTLSDLIKKRDSIFRIYPYRLDTVKDETVITDSYLIKNIDRAFESKKNRWAKGISFDDFCEYVLPYKVGNEEPETWGMCLDSEGYLNPDSLMNINDMKQATSYVNDHLSWYKGTIDYDYPIDIGYRMSRLIATGTCNSMTRMAVFEMRALGLPIVIDFSPTWGNRSEGHSWNALILNDRSYPFDANGPNIGFYKIEFKGVGRMPYKISKVFRRTFSIQKSLLTVLANNSEAVPDIFKSNRIKDVTDEYVPVSDITLNYDMSFENKLAYLYTFNNAFWTPSYWGQVTGKNIIFKKMGRDMVYLPSLYAVTNGNVVNIIPIGNPFILYADGHSKELVANTNLKQTVVVKKKYPEDQSNNIFIGNKYELFYWDGNWKSLGIQIAKSSQLYYSNAPMNALFWIRNLTAGKQERIFTYENGKQVWW
jgi:hypothetical protein